MKKAGSHTCRHRTLSKNSLYMGSRVFRTSIADFYQPLSILAARRRETRKRERQVKRKQRREVQGSRGATGSGKGEHPVVLGV